MTSGRTSISAAERDTTGMGTSFGPLKQIGAGRLNVGYAAGPAVLLLHGWPFDIHTYTDVTPLLAEEGYRVIVPYLHGHGTTRSLSDKTVRNGQQAAPAVDAIALMDALEIDEAVSAGDRSWGQVQGSSSALGESREARPRKPRTRMTPWETKAESASR